MAPASHPGLIAVLTEHREMIILSEHGDMTADCDSSGTCVTRSNDTWGNKWPVLAPECYLQYLHGGEGGLA